MMMRRSFLGFVAFVALLPRLSAQAVDLSESPLTDICFRQELSMELEGKVTMQQDNKPVTNSLSVEARHDYVERILEAANTPAEKSVRYYSKAEGTINKNKRSLPGNRNFLVAHRVKDQLVCYHPKEMLNLEEMELTEHFDTLAVSGLVPGKKVELGEKWKVSNATLAALCDLDGLTEGSVDCTLKQVENKIAHVSLIGNATGISLGAQVKLIVSGSYQFDLEKHRLVELKWNQIDQRDTGPVSPAMSAEVKYRLKRTALAETPSELSDLALVPIPQEKTPPQNLMQLVYQDFKNRYEMKYSREWHITAFPKPDQDYLVMRLMDQRGDFVAQATIKTFTSITDTSPAISKEKFEEFTSKSPGWQELEATEETKKIEESPKDHVYYRRIASGKLDDIATVQIFYYLSNPKGEQMFVTFAMPPNQAGNLAERDFNLIRDIIWPETK